MTIEQRGCIIGLTGPTGAGKSEAARLLSAAGIPVVDADLLAREVTAKGHPCLAELAEAFSETVLNADGTLNRAALAAAAFATPEATARLNAVTHPHILRLADERFAALWAAGATAVALDAPLLFESGMDRMCDRTVAVLAPAAIRQARICERDGISAEQAALRMQAQPDEAFYRERADDVLYNDGDLTAFRKTVKAWMSGYGK
ncbi:MAG: dephospho-CoA kinase [Ruminococcaceae bacterium]|nr:dephospho-CoA kinase [Oscillospiraceae bacterium]